MKTYPSLPRAADAPADLFDRGHLWIQEKVDGAHFRFQLRDTGVLRFGDRVRTFDPAETPPRYRHAVGYVQRNLDREALRSAVDDVESVVFFGEATHRRAIDYDWERTPSVLGFDVWSDEKGKFLPPDAVERIFTRLDLRPVNAFEKEVRASDFDPESYETPASNWYDGPAEGVVVRNKTGERATILHPAFETAGSEASTAEPAAGTDRSGESEASPEELAQEYATRGRFDRIAEELADGGRPITVDALYERALEEILREAHGRLPDGDSTGDARSFRSEVAALAGRYVEERH